MGVIDDRAIQLLNAELDGELSAVDRQELDALLSLQPGLRLERDAVRGLAGVLRSVADIDPPQDLAQRVVARITLPWAKVATWRLPDWLPNPFNLPSAALAAGLMVAVITYWSVPPGLLDDESLGMVGSMVHGPGASVVEAQGRFRVDLEGISGEVSLGAPVENVRVLDFDLRSSDSVDIEVNLADTGLEFQDLSRGEVGVELVASQGGVLRLSTKGARRFSVLLGGEVNSAAGAEPTMHVTISRNGQPIYQAGIEVP